MKRNVGVYVFLFGLVVLLLYALNAAVVYNPEVYSLYQARFVDPFPLEEPDDYPSYGGGPEPTGYDSVSMDVTDDVNGDYPGYSDYSDAPSDDIFGEPPTPAEPVPDYPSSADDDIFGEPPTPAEPAEPAPAEPGSDVDDLFGDVPVATAGYDGETMKEDVISTITFDEAGNPSSITVYQYEDPVDPTRLSGVTSYDVNGDSIPNADDLKLLEDMQKIMLDSDSATSVAVDVHRSDVCINGDDAVDARDCQDLLDALEKFKDIDRDSVLTEADEILIFEVLKAQADGRRDYHLFGSSDGNLKKIETTSDRPTDDTEDVPGYVQEEPSGPLFVDIRDFFERINPFNWF